MSSAKAAAFIALMFALGTALDRTSQAVLQELPMPWVVATLHFGGGMLWIFPAWTIGMRQTPRLSDTQKKRVAPLAFLHAAGHLCTLGVLRGGSLAVTQVFQAAEPIVVSVLSWVLVGNGQQHFVAWLALLLLTAGVLVTFREGMTAGSPVANLVAACAASLSSARTTFSDQVVLEEAVALKGQLCSMVFVSGTLVLIPFAIVMEGAELSEQWDRAAESIGSSSALIVKLIQGGTLLYMWSECLLLSSVEEWGNNLCPTAAVTALLRPMLLHSGRAFLGGGWATSGLAGTCLTALGSGLFAYACHRFVLKPPRTKQQ
ncbi:unnamed protein product [Scytosiphon promiscuus]